MCPSGECHDEIKKIYFIFKRLFIHSSSLSDAEWANEQLDIGNVA